MRRVQVRNNLCYDISTITYGALSGGTGSFFWSTHGGDQITVENNTCFQNRYAILFGDSDDVWKHYDFIYRNNVAAGNPQWNPDAFVSGGKQVGGSATLNVCAPSAVFARNVITNVPTASTSFIGTHLTENWYPVDFSGVLVNYNNGVPNDATFSGWKILNGSPYDNGGTDGKDIGCDIDAVVAATAGCISGVWPGGGGTTTVTLKNGVNGYTGASSFRVSGQQPTTNFGASAYYHPANANSGSSGFVHRPFYKFDLNQGANAIPAGATIQSATLKVKIEYSSGGADMGLAVHRVKPVNNAFIVSYTTATRNTYNGTNAWTGGANAGGDVANSNNDFLDTPDASGNMPADGNYMNFNVTSSVQAWMNGEPNNGWLFIPVARTVNIGTTSDLHGSADYPELTITYSSAPPSVTKVLKNGANGYTGSFSFRVSGQQPTTNFGASAYYHPANANSGSSGFVHRPFYKFDLSQGANAIPANATIESATLKVKIEYSSGSTDAGIKIHRVKPVNNAFTVNYATATRNTYNGTNSWTGGANAGGDAANSNNDFIDTPDAIATLPADGNYMTVNVTSSVQAWVNGEPNNGWLWIPNARTVNIGTSADLHGSADYPELTVTYH